MVIGLAVLPIAALIHIGGWGAVTAVEQHRPLFDDLDGGAGTEVLGVATILSLALIGLGSSVRPRSLYVSCP